MTVFPPSAWTRLCGGLSEVAAPDAANKFGPKTEVPGRRTLPIHTQRCLQACAYSSRPFGHIHARQGFLLVRKLLHRGGYGHFCWCTGESHLVLISTTIYSFSSAPSPSTLSCEDWRKPQGAGQRGPFFHHREGSASWKPSSTLAETSKSTTLLANMLSMAGSSAERDLEELEQTS